MAAADFAEHVLDGTGTLSKKMGVVELPLMPIFFSSAPFETPGNARSTRKAVNCSPSDFREDGEEIGLAAVRDPHLLAVEDVVRAVGREVGAGFGGEGIRAGLRFAEAVGADDFGARKLRQVLLFLRLGAEEQERQRADARVRAMPAAEGAVARRTVRRPTMSEVRSISMPP